MGRKSSAKRAAPGGHSEVPPGCFNGMWNVGDSDDTPVARKSLSERKFSEGFEAPRNSLDIASAALEHPRQSIASDLLMAMQFGFEFLMRKSADKPPPRVMVPHSAAAASTETRCRSPSVIARLMGLDTLPAAEHPLPQPASASQQSSKKPPLEAQAWKLMAERCDFLSSSSRQLASQQEKQQHFSRQLSSNACAPLPSKPHNHDLQQDDELLLFDVLPFREHPQEKQLQKLKREFQDQRSKKTQLEELKDQLMAKRMQIQRKLEEANSHILANDATKRGQAKFAESKEMLDAIQFLQSNKEFLVKFLREPNSVFAKHIYDLQALAAKEAAEATKVSSKSKVLSRTPKEIATQQQESIGFSRKLVDSKKDQELMRSSNHLKKEVSQGHKMPEFPAKQSIESDQEVEQASRIILLKPNNVKNQRTSCTTASRTKSREMSSSQEQEIKKGRSLKDVDLANTDPRELAREIARQARESVTKELENSKMLENSNLSKVDSNSISPRPWSLGRVEISGDVTGGEGSEPSSRRYTKDFQMHHSTASLPSSPRLQKAKQPSNVSSKEGRKQLMEKLKMAAQADKQQHQLQKESSSGTKVFIQIEVRQSASAQPSSKQQQQSKGLSEATDSKKHSGKGKLLKLFSRESAHSPAQKSTTSNDSPRLLVRSKSVSFVEEKSHGAEVLDRTHSCKQSRSEVCSRSTSPETSNSKGKFSSLKSSLLGKKKSNSARTSDKSPGASELSRSNSKSRGSNQNSRETETGCSASSTFTTQEDHFVQASRENDGGSDTHSTSTTPEAHFARTCEHGNADNKITLDVQSPRFLSLDIAGNLDHLDAASDIHTEKSEQPSPVSVLERAFLEESPSPVSFDDVTSDLQELQMRLERLKLDDSGRTWNVGEAKECAVSNEFILRHSARPAVNIDVDFDLSSSSDSPQCFDGDKDRLYIRRLIDASGFTNSIDSLVNWHSPSCPIDPGLFGKLEEHYSDSQLPSLWQTSMKRRGSRAQRKLKIGRSITQVQRRPEALHRQMLFDVVNMALSKKFQHLWDDQPWLKTGKQGIRPIPSGKNLLQEICKEISFYHHHYDSAEYPLENLVERDLNRGDQWMDTHNEMQRISSQVEADIFNGLVEEIAFGFMG